MTRCEGGQIQIQIHVQIYIRIQIRGALLVAPVLVRLPLAFLPYLLVLSFYSQYLLSSHSPKPYPYPHSKP